MTRIDFYILPDPAAEQRLEFACRLTQKAQQTGSQVYIAVNDQQQAIELDKRLWDFRPESFVAHDCEGQPPLQAQVAIGYGPQCGEHHGLLINLKDEIPEYFSRFERLAEVVCQQTDVLSQTREHFSFYRHRGYPIQSHDLRKN